MNVLKTFVVFLISFPSFTIACGTFSYGTYYIDQGYNILHKNLVSNEFRRVTNDSYISFYNDSSLSERELTKQVNLAEWAKFMQRSTKEAEAIIYQKEVDTTLDRDTIRYLVFVYTSEHLVDYENNWGRSANKALLVDYKKAIQVAEEGMAATKVDFLKLRYLFGAMRLAHYSKQYAEEQRLYDQYATSLQSVDSEVWQWIYALKAGMDKQQGRRVEAAYQFAKIFAVSKTKRYSAYIDFSIKTDQEWQALMQLCQSNDEKAAIHFLRALKADANSLQELKTIYALAPNSIWLDALLSRELEYVQFARQIDVELNKKGIGVDGINTQVLIDDVLQINPEKHPQLVTRRTNYINELSDIVEKIKTEGQHKDLFLADFAAVYLRVLKQQTVKLFDVGQLQLRYVDDPRAAYLDPLKLLVYLEHIPTVNDKIESEISIYLKKIQSYQSDSLTMNNMLTYSYIKLAPLYAQVLDTPNKQTDSAFKQYIARQRGEFIPDSILVFEVRALYALKNKSSRNFLEQQILNSSHDFLEFQSASFDEIIAKKYLSAGLFSKAEPIFADLPTKIDTQYNVFNSGLAGDNRDKRRPESTHKIVQKLATLQKEVQSDPNNAHSQYLLATVFYNMSWFGNSPMLTRYQRSTSDWKQGEIDLSKAKQHYQLALQHSQDRELSSKILYGLAKIEFAEKYMLADQGGNRFNEYSFDAGERHASIRKLKQVGFGKYFDELAQYNDTQYSREVIQQCSILRDLNP